MNMSVYFFVYVDPSDHAPSDKVAPQTLLEEEEPQTESCSALEQCSQSVSGLLDVPPPSICHNNSYSSSRKTSSGKKEGEGMQRIEMCTAPKDKSLDSC